MTYKAMEVTGSGEVPPAELVEGTVFGSIDVIGTGGYTSLGRPKNGDNDEPSG